MTLVFERVEERAVKGMPESFLVETAKTLPGYADMGPALMGMGADLGGFQVTAMDEGMDSRS